LRRAGHAPGGSLKWVGLAEADFASHETALIVRLYSLIERLFYGWSTAARPASCGVAWRHWSILIPRSLPANGARIG
jgi:hypothetical protein